MKCQNNLKDGRVDRTQLNNIRVTTVENYIHACDEIIADLEGENGIEALVDANSGINSELSGEYADALSNSVLEAKESYLESIANVRALRGVLIAYRNFLKYGKNEKLTELDDNKNVDVGAIYKQIRKLEETIMEDQKVKKVLQNSEDFDSWLNMYNAKLQTCSIETTEPYFFEQMEANRQAKREQKAFTHNLETYSNIISTLEVELTKTKSLVTELEVIAGVIDGELSDFSDIWESFHFNREDYHNYLVAHYDALTEQNFQEKIDTVKSIDYNKLMEAIAALSGIHLYSSSTSNDTAIDVLTNFLNNYVDKSSADRDLLLANIQQMLNDVAKEIASQVMAGNDASDLWQSYAKLKGLQALLFSTENILNNFKYANFNVTYHDGKFYLIDDTMASYAGTVEVNIPSLTPEDIQSANFIEDYKDSTFGADMAVIIIGVAGGALTGGAASVLNGSLAVVGFISATGDELNSKNEAIADFVDSLGIIVDSKGNVEYTLYSLLMIIELTKEYSENE